MTTYEDPNQGTAQITQSADGTTVRLPPRPIAFTSIFLAGWLVAWFFGESSALRSLQTGGNGASLFLFGWLVAWTAGGAYAFYILIWQTLGIQYLRVSGTDISSWSQILGINFARRNFILGDIVNLRVQHTTVTNRNGYARDMVSVAFDYGRRTVSTFSGIDEAEASYICNQLKNAAPQLRVGNSTD